MSFWENFERICRNRKTTPSACVKKLGLSPSKVTYWHNGSLPKEEIIGQLAELLKVSKSDFFVEDEKPLVEPADDDEKDIIALYRRLDRKQKHEFMAMVYQYDREIQKGDSSEKIG